MKKKLRILLSAAACLVIFYLGFLIAGMTIPRSFRQLPQKTGGMAPVRAAHSIAILPEDSYPGFSDIPVTAEQAAPGRKAVYALEQQTYTLAFPLCRPHTGGISIYKLSGCSPEYKAYWDGRYLWLPKGFDGPWMGYRPSDPEQLNQALESIYNS